MQEGDDRRYFVKVDDVFKTVKLQGRLVNWLLNLNAQRRADAQIDKSFIKSLLIAVFTVKLIKAGDALEPGLIEFIKGTMKIFSV